MADFPLLGVLLISALTLLGCSDAPRQYDDSLDPGQMRTELSARGITIPDDYTLVSMTKMYVAGPGGPSYRGVLTAAPPIKPILIDGKALPMKPVACKQIPSQAEQWQPLGLDCNVKDVTYGSARPAATSVMSVSILSSSINPGESQIYLLVIGN